MGKFLDMVLDGAALSYEFSEVLEVWKNLAMALPRLGAPLQFVQAPIARGRQSGARHQIWANQEVEASLKALTRAPGTDFNYYPAYAVTARWLKWASHDTDAVAAVLIAAVLRERCFQKELAGDKSHLGPATWDWLKEREADFGWAGWYKHVIPCWHGITVHDHHVRNILVRLGLDHDPREFVPVLVKVALIADEILSRNTLVEIVEEEVGREDPAEVAIARFSKIQAVAHVAMLRLREARGKGPKALGPDGYQSTIQTIVSEYLADVADAATMATEQEPPDERLPA